MGSVMQTKVAFFLPSFGISDNFVNVAVEKIDMNCLVLLLASIDHKLIFGIC